MSIFSLKCGDKVRITSNDSDHKFEIGQIVFFDQYGDDYSVILHDDFEDDFCYVVFDDFEVL